MKLTLGGLIVSTLLSFGILNVVSANVETPILHGSKLLTPEDEAQISTGGATFAYQSDVARLLRTVVHHLYHDREVFARELLSNSNDALEKTRILSLTDSTILTPAPDLNITIISDPSRQRIIIRDTGIGMTKDQLVENLGTIARSGTSEFLEKLEKVGSTDKGAEGGGNGKNLIGQFGLGFYSSFLVADKVTVASKSNEDPIQHIFESTGDESGFSIVQDPRGNTLGRGTEITLWVKEDAIEYLEPTKLRSLISRHAEWGASPIYLWTETTAEEVIEGSNEDDVKKQDKKTEGDEDDEVKVEDETESDSTTVKTQTVVRGEWQLVNNLAPLWMRDPKEVTEEQYEDFYKKTFTQPEPPLSWSHFKGDAGSTSFRALIYIPESLPNDFYAKTYQFLESIKLFVRRVFITSDLGSDYLPKYLNWVKIFVDADDLPLSVDRDSLQKSKALGQIQRNLIKRTLDLFATLAKNDPEKFTNLYKKCGIALKLGAVEDPKNRDRITKLLRFDTTASATNQTSLSDYVAKRKKGQEQIFFIASAGEKRQQLEQSPFVERLVARGYEVLLFTEPMDEILVSSLHFFEGLNFQDVAKKGLKMGDEEEDEDEKAELEELKTTFEPLSTFLKKKLSTFVDDVVISNRLTTSPCLVVTGTHAWTGNMERLARSQNGENVMAGFMSGQKKTFEINPKHPLIEGMLEKVEETEGDEIAENELDETVQVLWQTALVRSGFNVEDPNQYFKLVESLLRRSLGVAQNAEAKGADSIKPAPPMDPINVAEDLEDSEDSEAVDAESPPTEWKDWAKMKESLGLKGGVQEESEQADKGVHDEL